PSLAFAIQGGERVATGSALASAAVALQFQMGKPNEWWHHCTAVLIAEDLAMTAAHCVPEPAAMRPLRLAFTTDTTQGSFPTRPITGFVRDEKFQDKVLHEEDDHDLALVRFSGGLPPGARPVRVLSAAQSSLLAIDSAVTIAGFGSENFQQYETGNLRWTKVFVAMPLKGQTETLLDQREKGGTCPGDSGGPAFLEKDGELILWGIASRLWPLHVNDCGRYSIYSRLDIVASWLEWAQNELRK
ncbi:MAG: S1 family peptidase, partial [Bdellovibrionota bacterium]